MHEVDIVHVEAQHDVFDVVDDVVERLAHLDDVLAVDGGDEVGGDRLEDLVVDRVALVLDLMRLLRVLFERGCFRELLDGSTNNADSATASFECCSNAPK